MPSALSLTFHAQECLDKFTQSLSHKLDSHAVSGGGWRRGGGPGHQGCLRPTFTCWHLLPRPPHPGQELLDATQHTLQQQIQTLVKE